MPGKSKKGGGLEVSPYTMKGHTLPGPFQKKGSPYKNGKGKKASVCGHTEKRTLEGLASFFG